MKTSKPMAMLILAATLVPSLYLAYFVLCIVVTAATQSPTAAPWPPDDWLTVLHLLSIVWTWGLIGIYVLFALRSDAVPKHQRTLWIVGIVLANLLAMPVFWYMFIWRSHGAGTPTDRGN